MMEVLGQYSGIIGLLAFFIFFVLMAAYLYRPGAKQKYSEYANIPFTEDGHGTQQ